MLNKKEFKHAEELSECLDHLNYGSFPITQDEEILRLVETASLVKLTYSQGPIPHQLISELVDNLATELKGRKQLKWHRNWWYGGLIGTAAAILIVAFAQFVLPQTADHYITQQFNDSIVPQRNVEVDSRIDQQLQSGVQSGKDAKTPMAQSDTKKDSDDFSNDIAEKMPVDELPKIAEQPNQVAMLQPKDVRRTKSIVMAEIDNNSLREDKKGQLEPEIAIMVLPNQIAQSITVDNDSGVIRQVYNQGTTDEIIITQHPLEERILRTRDNNMQATAENIALQPIDKEHKDPKNSLTVEVGKYSMTIEGKKTQEELEKIAASLTMEYRKQ